MKVIFYGDVGGSGGYYRYCKGLLASGSVPKDITVYFITSKNFYSQLGSLDQNVKVITHDWMDSTWRIKRYLWYLWIFPKIVRNLKPDLEFYSSGKLRVYFRKAITVATCHNLLLFDETELSRIKLKQEKEYFLKYRKSYIRSYKKSDALIFLSNHSRDVILPQINLNKKSWIISHGLDIDFIFKGEREYSFKDEINILYVSPVFHYKNHLNVVKAFEILKEEVNFKMNLQLVGGGNSSAYDELTDYVDQAELGNCVTFKQFVDTSGLINAYATCDLFIFASSCETFGITLLEAMGAKLPIACSNKTGLHDILKDGGVYFDPFQVTSIVSALKVLIQNVEERELLGNKAFEYAENYKWENSAIKTYEFLRLVCKNTS